MGNAVKILALDQSKSNTGWAAWQPGWDKPRFGSVQLGSEYTSDGQTFTKLREVIIDLYSAVLPFEYLVFEEPFDGKLLIGLRAIILNVGYEFRCRSVRGIQPQSWQIDFCGRDEHRMMKRAARIAKQKFRDPLKEAIMEKCRLLGMNPKNVDESDAIGILTYAILTNGTTPPWIADEVLRPLAGGGR